MLHVQSMAVMARFVCEAGGQAECMLGMRLAVPCASLASHAAGDPFRAPRTRAQIVAHTARFVREAGGQAEFVLRVRQAANPAFAFLAPGDRRHAYFRWLLEAAPQAS